MAEQDCLDRVIIDAHGSASRISAGSGIARSRASGASGGRAAPNGCDGGDELVNDRPSIGAWDSSRWLKNGQLAAKEGLQLPEIHVHRRVSRRATLDQEAAASLVNDTVALSIISREVKNEALDIWVTARPSETGKERWALPRRVCSRRTEMSLRATLGAAVCRDRWVAHGLCRIASIS